MILAKFKIKAKKTDKYFLVYVYENRKELQRAARLHAKKTGSDQNFMGSAGVCHTYERVTIHLDNGKETIKPEIGTIRLCKKYLSTLVVSHEVSHAGLWLYRKLYGTEHEWEGSSENACFGTGCNGMEEDFCYLVSELFVDMTKKLYKYKFWE